MKAVAIIYHKHPTSARTQFVRFSYDSVIGLEKLPSLTCISDEGMEMDQDSASDVMNSVRQYFGFENKDLCLDDEFNGAVETPNRSLPVYLLAIKGMDPPFAAVEEKGAKFIALTEARGLPDYELLLLQKAYKAIMEG